MLKVTVALCVIAYTSACCWPDEWEAWIGLQIGSYNTANKTGHLIEGSIRIAYDFTHKIIGEHQYLVNDGNQFQQDVVLDYNSKMMFVINNGSCEKYRLNDFPEHCFPDSGDSTEAFTYGFGSNAVAARGYRFEVNQTTVFMSVDSANCAPLATDTVFQSSPFYRMQVATYSNVTAGISDRGIFNVPTACATVSTIHPAVAGIGMGKRSTLM